MRDYRKYLERRSWFRSMGLLETWFIRREILTKEELNKEKKDK